MKRLITASLAALLLTLLLRPAAAAILHASDALAFELAGAQSFSQPISVTEPDGLDTLFTGGFLVDFGDTFEARGRMTNISGSTLRVLFADFLMRPENPIPFTGPTTADVVIADSGISSYLYRDGRRWPESPNPLPAELPPPGYPATYVVPGGGYIETLYGTEVTLNAGGHMDFLVTAMSSSESAITHDPSQLLFSLTFPNLIAAIPNAAGMVSAFEIQSVAAPENYAVVFAAPVPLPAALPLLASTLPLFGWLSARSRSRRATAGPA